MIDIRDALMVLVLVENSGVRALKVAASVGALVWPEHGAIARATG
jgi:hypothetical protein